MAHYLHEGITYLPIGTLPADTTLDDLVHNHWINIESEIYCGLAIALLSPDQKKDLAAKAKAEVATRKKKAQETEQPIMLPCGCS